MKTLKYIFVLGSILLVSCNKMLDIQPTDAISSDEAITDKSGVEKAIYGSYDAFQLAGLYGRNRVILGDLAADNLVWTGTNMDYSQIDDNTVSIDNGIIDGMWTGAYDGINRVNNILVAGPQRRDSAIASTVRAGLFAYNEAPTIAVAIDCWFRARHFSTRPFFFPHAF